LKRVITFGESLLDIIYNPAHIIPGGSILNASVSLARSSVPVQLMTEFATDGPGRILLHFLQTENIGIDYSCVYHEGQTALAFALLDENAKASYTFYKSYPSKRFNQALPFFDHKTIFLFGSFSALDDALNETVSSLLSKAKAAESLIYYDPNYRKTATIMDDSIRMKLNHNMKQADIIRGSDEDFESIFGTADLTKVWGKLQPSACKLLVITHGADKVEAINKHFQLHFPVPKTHVVSTIGAGDAFNAGFISAIPCFPESELDSFFYQADQIKYCIERAIHFAAAVCASELNYIPTKFV